MQFNNSKRVIFQVFVVAFIVNFIWENAQAPLYAGYNNFGQHFWICFWATFFDALFVTLMYGLINLLRKGRYNFSKLKQIEVSLILVISLITAIVIEFRALSEGKWAYNQFMPLVYIIGVTPLIQLFITTLLSFKVIKVFIKK